MSTIYCKEARTLLMAYLDSELDAVTTVSVREHLTVCPACSQRFEQEGVLEAALAEQLREGSMPDDLSRLLDEQLEAERPEAGGVLRRPVFWRWAAAAAIFLAAVGLAIDGWGWGWGGGDPITGGLVEELVVSWEGAAGLDAPATVHGRRKTRSLLNDYSLLTFDLPMDGVIGGHPVSLVGAREESFHGVRAVNVLYDCCGALTSVFVMKQDALDSLPRNLRKPMDDQLRTLDGVRARTSYRNGLLIGVVSRHPTTLEDHWSS